MIRNILGFVLTSLFVLATIAGVEYPKFDRGPDPQDPMQRELLEIIRDMPYLPGISEQLEVLAPSYKRGQKMRPDFGAMPIRGFAIPNSVSVLVIGQDATHIAEAANRPGIAGFGGRVQDMLKHFGVIEGVIFTNLFVNTISGQYGSRNTPVLNKNSNSIQYTNVIENRQWLMTHEGPYAEWRNRFLSWIIRNNKESLKMVMMLGQAGKDAGANFVNSIGGKVSASVSTGDGSKYDIPLFVMVSAGGNNEWAVPVSKGCKLNSYDKCTGLNHDKLLSLINERESVSDTNTKQQNIVATEINQVADRITRKENFNANEFIKSIEAGSDVNELLRKIPIARARVIVRNWNKIRALTDEYNSSTEKAKIYERNKKKIEVLNKRLQKLEKGIRYSDTDRDKTEYSVDNVRSLTGENAELAKELMVFSHGGPNKNGVLVAEQIGGWDLKTMEVYGKKTRSIKGLKVPCNNSKNGDCAKSDYIVAPDILFVGSPHPTSLSMSSDERASQMVEEQLLQPLKDEKARGWIPPTPEAGQISRFNEGLAYEYGRASIPRSHGDPGITDLRLMPVSDAGRKGKGVIVVGTRDAAVCDKEDLSSKKFLVDCDRLKSMENDLASSKELMKENSVLTGRPQTKDYTVFDRGPSDEFGNLLFSSINRDQLFAAKPEYLEKAKASDDFEKNYNYYARKFKPQTDEEIREVERRVVFDIYGIDAFNTKSHPDAGLFGHYRGTFDSPEVVILADPHGYDSFITSKAQTGARGQYLHGMMEDLKINERYLVLSTVPVAMDNANKAEWQYIYDQTKQYRKDLIEAIFAKSDKKPIFIADGEWAIESLKEILGSKARVYRKKVGKNFTYIKRYTHFVALERGSNPLENVNAGIKDVGELLAKRKAFKEAGVKEADIKVEMRDIPRSHLTWIARVWEGTSGDRVITSAPGDKLNGKAFMVVAPKWARRNNVFFKEKNREIIRSMQTKLAEAGEPLPGESTTDYLDRRDKCSSRTESQSANAKPICEFEMTDVMQFPYKLAN